MSVRDRLKPHIQDWAMRFMNDLRPETVSEAQGEVLEVGWKKLNGFEIPNDAEVAVTADGYMLPVEVVLDDNKGGEGDDS